MTTFVNIFETDIDLSLTGFDRAFEHWLSSDREGPPKVIWISDDNAAYTKSFLAALAERDGVEFAEYWDFAIAREYKADQWSMGTWTDRGFGSKGSGVVQQVLSSKILSNKHLTNIQDAYQRAMSVQLGSLNNVTLQGQLAAQQQQALMNQQLSGMMAMGLSQAAPAPAPAVTDSDLRAFAKKMGLL